MMNETPGATDRASDKDPRVFRDLLLGFVRIHILHHASRHLIYGSGISTELSRHGYRLSWGTLYPLLHSLEEDGLLAQVDHAVSGKVRKYYRITPSGQHALAQARQKAVELIDELLKPQAEK